MFEIGILQGRLSVDIDGRFQFFPKDWKQEFVLAKQFGFAGIEWLVDPKGWQSNPAFAGDPVRNPLVTNQLDVPILSVCADWFMEHALWDGDATMHRMWLGRLIGAAQFTKHKVILIPLLENQNLNLHQDRWKDVVSVLKPLEGQLQQTDVRIGFETELTADDSHRFIDQFESNRFGIYFDTGNATSYDFDCAEDIVNLDKKIFGVHLKDRKRFSSQTVPLGKGDTDFGSVFTALAAIGWQGTPIMQAWRGRSYIADAKRQLKFLTAIQKRS